MISKNSLKWLVGLILPAFFVACDDPDTTGVELSSSDDLGKSTLVDTFSIDMKTVLDNKNIATTGASALLVGDYNDPTFGMVNAASYFDFNFPVLNFGTSPICDSIKLVLGYSSVNIYGDLSTLHEIDVFELSQEIASDVTYYAHDSLSVTGGNISELLSFYPYPSDTSSITITLTKEFGQKILNAPDETTLSDLKGLALKSKKMSSVLGFNVTNRTYLQMYWHNTLDTGVVTYFTNARFNQISSDRKDATLKGLVNDGDSIDVINEKLFVQSGAGVNTVLKMDGLNEWLAMHAGVNIDRALLYIYADTTTGQHTSMPAQLRLYKGLNNKIDNNILFVDQYESRSGGVLDAYSNYGNFIVYNETIKGYIIPMTFYLQSKLDQKEKLDQLILAPVSSYRASRLEHVILNSDDASFGARAMRLEIHYSGKK